MKMMIKIRLNVHGCDDSTCFDLEVTDQELEFLKKIVDKCNNTKTYGFMPGMEIEFPDNKD